MKIWRIFPALILTILCWQVLQQYFFCTRFDFNPHRPFAGEQICNPYDGIAANQWLKCNFHAHVAAWKGITNGHGKAGDIHHAYDSLGYGVHCVTNYQQIDTVRTGAGIYIPAYEHGFNIQKTHQQVLGAAKVWWPDYIFPQVMSNKQDLLNALSSDTNAAVVLNHPVIRNGYTAEDLACLSNYHCMEVLNPAGTSFAQWDAVLSAGKPVFIVGNDDIHNIVKKDRLGRMCTFVSVPVKDASHVLKALKTGKSYGVIIGAGQDPYHLPVLNKLSVTADTISLEMDQPAVKIEFTGQHGRLLASFNGTSAATYILKKEDHYARASITYPNGTSIFLNPVYFTRPGANAQSAVFPDHFKTFLFRCAGIVLAAVNFRLILLLLFGRNSWVNGPFSILSPKKILRGLHSLEKNRRKRIAW